MRQLSVHLDFMPLVFLDLALLRQAEQSLLVSAWCPGARPLDSLRAVLTVSRGQLGVLLLAHLPGGLLRERSR
jgi:hypothetical protein